MVALNTEGYPQQTEAARTRPEGMYGHQRWAYHEPLTPEEGRRNMLVVWRGSIIEAIGGATVVLLTILALFGVAPTYLVPISVIVLGCALLFDALAIGSRFWRLPDEITSGVWAPAELLMATGIGVLAGITGVVLGIIALSGVAPITLTAVCALVFGTALIFGAGLPNRFNRFEVEQTVMGSGDFRRTMTVIAGVCQAIIGATVVVLAIIALAGNVPVTLTTVSMLLLGCALLLSGTAVAGRITGMLHRD